jgi:hypothetical protein
MPPYPCRHQGGSFEKEDSVFDPSNEIILNFLVLSLSAKGLVAIGLTLPVALLIGALAWRIVRR